MHEKMSIGGVILKKTKKISAALDATTLNFVEQIGAQDDVPYSEVIRRAITFYNENRRFPIQKHIAYLDMLSSGDHIIIDIDHWYLFLDFIQSSPNQDIFWTKLRDVARFQGEQLRNKVSTVDELLNKLEICNLFKVIKTSEDDFTLTLGSELPRKFIVTFLEEFFSAIEMKVSLKANLSKINVHYQATGHR